ncbi:MAG: hypothetical protein IPL65_19235 [Lewinellaceae bacterium]|nr:hypothetical protein [Lewinellaceae bacterium]
MPVFYSALALILLSMALKPNISTLLGNLSNWEQYKGFKDDGYNIFYMGVTIGALICNFVAAIFAIPMVGLCSCRCRVSACL